MAKDKHCPLTFTTGKGAYDQEVSDFSYCREKSCAWWDNLAGLCAVLVIAQFGEEGSFYRQRQERKEALDSARGK